VAFAEEEFKNGDSLHNSCHARLLVSRNGIWGAGGEIGNQYMARCPHELVCVRWRNAIRRDTDFDVSHTFDSGHFYDVVRQHQASILRTFIY